MTIDAKHGLWTSQRAVRQPDTQQKGSSQLSSVWGMNVTQFSCCIASNGFSGCDYSGNESTFHSVADLDRQDVMSKHLVLPQRPKLFLSEVEENRLKDDKTTLCQCELKWDGNDSPPRGQPISKCRWWEITDRVLVWSWTHATLLETVEFLAVLRSQQLCKGPHSTTSGQSQSAIIVLEFIKGLMEHNYLGKLTHACSFQAVFFLC